MRRGASIHRFKFSVISLLAEFIEPLLIHKWLPIWGLTGWPYVARLRAHAVTNQYLRVRDGTFACEEIAANEGRHGSRRALFDAHEDRPRGRH